MNKYLNHNFSKYSICTTTHRFSAHLWYWLTVAIYPILEMFHIFTISDIFTAFIQSDLYITFSLLNLEKSDIQIQFDEKQWKYQKFKKKVWLNWALLKRNCCRTQNHGHSHSNKAVCTVEDMYYFIHESSLCVNYLKACSDWMHGLIEEMW